MTKRQWKTRTSGSSRQIGKHFVLSPSSQKMKSQLPTVTKTRRGTVTQVTPERALELSLVKVKTAELVNNPNDPLENIEERSDYFVDMYKRGLTIAPILVHKLPNGKYEIIDGHARALAYRKLGIKEIPAVENGILEKFGHAAKIAGRAVAKGAKIGYRASRAVVREGLRTGSRIGEIAEEGLSQAGRLSRAYKGEVSEREQMEHEEKLAEIRSRRPPSRIITRHRIYRPKESQSHSPEGSSPKTLTDKLKHKGKMTIDTLKKKGGSRVRRLST